MNKILLVEDSKEIFVMVDQAVGFSGELTWAPTIEKAKDKLNDDFDLILLDIDLPDGSGLDFCSEISSKMPGAAIFFLTSHKTLSEKVLGFSAGADDYITKPFETLELKARIEAKLKKNKLLKQEVDILKWNEISIDKSKQEVNIFIDGNSKAIDLTALEFKLLTYLAKKPGHVIPRDKVLNDIWGEEVYVYQRSVDTHISKLRKKLEGVSHIIESVRGAGYRFSPT